MKKYQGIQVLRFVAAGFVVLAHMIGNVLHKWPDPSRLVLPPLGEVGVFVFFGISGFIMVSTQYDAFGRTGSAGDFFLRRLLRILPIYAIATALQYINKLHVSEHYNWLNLAKSLAFIPYIGEKGMYRPVLGQGWTLDLEMFFYAVFAVCLLCRRTVGLTICMTLFVLLPACSRLNLQAFGVLGFYADRILIYFVCGMLAALAHRRFPVQFGGWGLPFFGCLALIGGALAIPLAAGVLPELITFSNLLMVFLVVWLAASCHVMPHGKAIRVFERLGDASYSTYLFHSFVVGALKVIAYRVPQGDYLLLVVACAISLLASNIVGLLAYKHLEIPISRAVHGYARAVAPRKPDRSVKDGAN